MTLNAFTLIELLVVIAIIAILAAILFPVFAQAKLAAQKTVDLSNIKQIGTAIVLYLNDNDDTYPPVRGYDESVPWVHDPFWSSKEIVGRYVASTNVFLSPGEPSETVTHFSSLVPPGFSAPPRSYMVNGLWDSLVVRFGTRYTFGPNWIPNSSGSVFGFWNSYPRWPFDVRQFPKTQSNIASPSELIILTAGAEEWNQYSDPRFQATTEIAGGSRVDIVDGIDAVSLASGRDQRTGAFDSHLQRAWTRFAGGSNFGFADTSAKFLKPGSLMRGAYLNPRRWQADPGSN